MQKITPIGFCQSISLTPVNQYYDNILQQGWGFNSDDMDKLAVKMDDHVNTSIVSSVSIWLKGDFGYNWDEAIKWVKGSVESLGRSFKIRLFNMKLYHPSRDNLHSESSIEAIKLNLRTIDVPISGLSLEIRGVRKRCTALQTLHFFALNPQLLVGMDEGTIPILLN